MKIRLFDGEEIEAVRVNGYLYTQVDYVNVRVSAVVWQKAFNETPPTRIYHIDGNKMNIDPSNLSSSRDRQVNDRVREACRMISKRYCMRMGNRVMDKATGAIVYPDYNKLLKLGVIYGYDPVFTTLTFGDKMRFVMYELHEDWIEEVDEYVKRLRSTRSHR